MLEEQMGQLIAELSKFGGFEKKKSNQLARIILEHIRANYISKAEALAKLKNLHRYSDRRSSELECGEDGYTYGLEDAIKELGLENTNEL